MAQLENRVGNARATGAATASPMEAGKSAEVARQQSHSMRSERRAEKAEALAAASSKNEPVSGNNIAAATVGRSADELKSMPEPGTMSQQVTVQAAAPVQSLGAKKAAPMNTEEQARDQAPAVALPMMQAEVTNTRAAAKSGGAARNVTGSIAGLMNKATELPSGLAAVSTALVQRNVLAVDKAGGVFLSTDSGEHWDSIGRQWSGQAAAVRTRPESKDGTGRGAAQTGFELVNDQGQVWVSADGRSWSPK
jgi:hypothetical protein